MTQPFNPAAFTQPPQQGQVNPMQQPNPYAPQTQAPAYPAPAPAQATAGYPPVGYPAQPQAPAGYGAPPAFGGANPGASQGLNMAALAQALGAAAMGATHSQVLPVGDYIAAVDRVEIAEVGQGQRKQRCCFVEVLVEQSSNPMVQPGHKGKLAPVFLDSDYDAQKALAQFVGFIGQLTGCPDKPTLDARFPTWASDVSDPASQFARGIRLSVQSRIATGRGGEVKKDKAGNPRNNTSVQRVG